MKLFSETVGWSILKHLVNLRNTKSRVSAARERNGSVHIPEKDSRKLTSHP